MIFFCLNLEVVNPVYSSARLSCVVVFCHLKKKMVLNDIFSKSQDVINQIVTQMHFQNKVRWKMLSGAYDVSDKPIEWLADVFPHLATNT